MWTGCEVRAVCARNMVWIFGCRAMVRTMLTARAAGGAKSERYCIRVLDAPTAHSAPPPSPPPQAGALNARAQGRCAAHPTAGPRPRRAVRDAMGPSSSCPPAVTTSSSMAAAAAVVMVAAAALECLSAAPIGLSGNESSDPPRPPPTRPLGPGTRIRIFLGPLGSRKLRTLDQWTGLKKSLHTSRQTYKKTCTLVGPPRSSVYVLP
jgi:hypothetical protein